MGSDINTTIEFIAKRAIYLQLRLHVFHIDDTISFFYSTSSLRLPRASISLYGQEQYLSIFFSQGQIMAGLHTLSRHNRML